MAKTPVRPIRIDDDLWKAAQRVADDLARETGLSATPSDVVRKALVEYIERWKASKKAIKNAAADVPKNSDPAQGF